jgi:transcription elongation factor Elf1
MVFSKFLNTRKKACPVCGKKFDCDPLDLSRHVEQHFASSNHAEGNTYYQQTDYQISLTEQTTDDALLARAIADIEAEDAVIIPLSPHTTDQPPSVPIFTCPICHNTLLDTPEQRMEHEQLHAEMDAVTYSSSASSPTHDTSDTTYRCPRCDQIGK